MDLLRAALDPASHSDTARPPLDLPTGRVLSTVALADAEEGGKTHLSLLAAGISMAPAVLTLELAGRSEQSPEEFLTSMNWVAEDRSG